MADEMHEFGIVLSGGGARGIVHIGMLKELEKHNLVPGILAGASMGAIVACLYAAGNSADDLMKILKKVNFRRIYSAISLRGGLLSLGYLKEVLHNYIGNDNFYSLSKPVYVVASNLNKGSFEVFSTGPLYDIIIASTTIPFLFRPAKLNGSTYIDGGFYNNLPADVIRKKCKVLLGSHVNYNGPFSRFNGRKDILDRIFSQSIYSNVKLREPLCDILISPQILQYYSLFSFDRADELYEIGRREMAKKIPELKRQLRKPKTINQFISKLFKES